VFEKTASDDFADSAMGEPASLRPEARETGDDLVADSCTGGLVASWQEAEALAAWHMRELGFDEAAVTGAGADGGIDVVAGESVAQVKHYSKSPVGAPAVQQLRGAAMKGEWALFYSWSGYTRAAIDFADAAKVALFRYDQDATVTAVNDVARFLLRARDVEVRASPERFELERRAQAVGQQYFDLATKAFFAVAQEAIDRIKIDGSPTLLRAAQVESERVKVIVRQVGSGRVDFEIFLTSVEQIREARKRLQRDLAL
jgi:hypothetical protein